MSIELIKTDGGCRLLFSGCLTYEFSGELEDQIIDVLRNYRVIEIDLSGVTEVDLCGLHLLGILESIGRSGVRILADSAVVERARQRLAQAGRGYWLRGHPKSRPGSTARPAGSS